MGESSATFVLTPVSADSVIRSVGGGKAYNLAKLSNAKFPVPEWICLSADALDLFLEHHGLTGSVSTDGLDPQDIERM